MAINAKHHQNQLFHFGLPGLQLPGVILALSLDEALEVTDPLATTPIPFAPTTILGLAEWRGRLLTAIDLRLALSELTGKAHISNTGNGEDCRSLIAQMVVDDQLELVTWSVTPGAGTIVVPAYATRAEVPSTIMPDSVRQAIYVEGQTVILLDLAEVVARLFPREKNRRKDFLLRDAK